MRCEIRKAAPEFKLPFRREGILDEANLRKRGEGMVGLPGLDRGEWLTAHHPRVGEQAEQPQHGHTAESDALMSLMFPIMAGAGVVLMVGVNERQPEIQVGKVNVLHPLQQEAFRPRGWKAPGAGRRSVCESRAAGCVGEVRAAEPRTEQGHFG